MAALLLALGALQLAYSARIPLFGDEAYYWVWSQHPALSYFDHPPMIAWLLALATLPAVSEWSVRLVPVLCTGLSAWLIQQLAREIYGPRAAYLALAIFLVMPATQIGALVATPDAPLLLFWSFGLYAAHRAIFTGGRGWHWLTGIAVGLALLSKYTATLFPAALLVFLLLRRRDVLARTDTWLAMLTGMLLFAPVLVWNFHHDWISFAFQYQHGTASEAIPEWGPWLEFLAGTALIFSPVLFIVALAAALSPTTRGNDQRLYLATLFVLPLGFFAYKGLFHKMELNWVAVAFPAAIILAAGFICERGQAKTTGIGLTVALVLSLALKFPVAMGLPAKWNPLNRLYANRDAAMALLALSQPGEGLLADHYTTASLLSFYSPRHPSVRIPGVSRFSQYDLWAADQPPTQPQGLYLASDEMSPDLRQQCGNTALLSKFTASRPGFVPKTFYVYRCGA